jgi:hypothetical protein
MRVARKLKSQIAPPIFSAIPRQTVTFSKKLMASQRGTGNGKFPVKTMILFSATGLFTIGYGIFVSSGWWKVGIIIAGLNLLAPVAAKFYFGGNRDD